MTTLAQELRDAAPWVPGHIAPLLLRAADSLTPPMVPFGYRTIVLVQPQGTGKSNITAEQFGCCGIVDEWHDRKTMISGYLHLTNVMLRDVPAGVEVILSQPPSPNQATA